MAIKSPQNTSSVTSVRAFNDVHITSSTKANKVGDITHKNKNECNTWYGMDLIFNRYIYVVITFVF